MELQNKNVEIPPDFETFLAELEPIQNQIEPKEKKVMEKPIAISHPRTEI